MEPSVEMKSEILRKEIMNLRFLEFGNRHRKHLGEFAGSDTLQYRKCRRLEYKSLSELRHIRRHCSAVGDREQTFRAVGRDDNCAAHEAHAEVRRETHNIGKPDLIGDEQGVLIIVRLV